MTYFRMALCLDGESELIRGEFDSLADGVAWVRKNHPGFIESTRWESEDRGPDGPRQYGTDYHWVAFEPLLGERPA